ncbi:hypothetical protein [Candidatus Agathobaculum pullicola]|uniref:hypothetical protein n=1 Tax=Candidatus Agathobaculum pullicola TaxID=2838426 RepID=UPI003F9027AC
MDENLEGIQRPIYHNLWVYWLMQLIGLVLLPFAHIIASLMGFVVGVVQLYELYTMREVSDGMGRAWRTMLLSLILTFGGLILTLLAIGSVLSILLLLVTLAGLIVMIVADYYFYFALDELILPRGYSYPSGRIRWCFWLSLIGGIIATIVGAASSFLALVVQIVIAAVIVWLLWQYLQAVKAKEGA